MKFGESLKKERLRAGVSLGSVSEGTKVSVRHLEALEEDDPSRLPGGVFNRGIVQSYCRFLGLEEATWLETYTRQYPLPQNDNWGEFAEAVKRTRVQTTPLVERRWWGVLLMLIGLGALGWAAWHFVVQPRMGKSLRQTIPQAFLSNH
ncbi:MAG: helix-turn-helix domain-containing protein [Acidobacteriaceae bacterium]|nr:helix-turn-helix domain-containing protein [Acidobacteriaceae bacterium]